MVFDFKLLGLLVMFFMLIIFYSKKLKNDYDKKFFKALMLSSYIIEFLYLINYIIINSDIKYNTVISKLYLFSLTTYMSILVGYFIVSLMKDKYKVKDTVFISKAKMIRNMLIPFNILMLVFIYFMDISFYDGFVSGTCLMITYIVISVYILLGFLVLLIYSGIDNRKKIRTFLTANIITLVAMVLQYYFYSMSSTIINGGFILTTLFLYLMLEINEYDELEKLKLEKDTVIKSSDNANKFLTNMSYEIRTPLNAIDGLSQVIEDSDDIKTIKEDAKDIRMASKNLINVINGIIDISSIETGKLEINNDNYNIYTMLNNVGDITKSKLTDSKVEFKLDIAENIPKVLNGDSDRIEQILLNLLTNAIKYTDSGYIMLKVDAINSAALCRLKITVSDTGIGIKEEDINNLFERDNRGDSNKLGLVIVKKLVDLMNGKIDVESIYEKGSTFTITIDQKVVKTEEIETEDDNRKLDIIDASGKRVLVVDDNKLNLKVASKLLDPYNVEIINVSSGEECLDILDKDTNFDLILMDDMMPNMSGTETLQIIRKIERVDNFYIPIVVLTANAISGMKDKYIKEGFEDYLAKPIDKYELNRIIKKYLK